MIDSNKDTRKKSSSRFRSLALTIAYDGAAFNGFAKQPGQRTVQGVLEQTIEMLLKRPATVTGAGRTDSGVHALGQVVSFDLLPEESVDTFALRRSLSALAGEHLSVTNVHEFAEGFSARFDAVAREYRYRIVVSPNPPIFTANHVWWRKRTLDVDAMRRAAQLLIGEHDFRSFCVADSADRGPTVRTLDRIEIVDARELGEDVIEIRIEGGSFLHSMVRVIVGTLYEVGVGGRPETWVTEVLEARDRAVAGQTAPAHGLTLWRVRYPQEW